MSSTPPNPKPTNSNSPIDITVRSLCVRVPKGEGESVRKKLLELGVLDAGLKIIREDGHILFPVLSDSIPGLELCEEEFDERRLMDVDYKSLVLLPEELRPLLPTSFDVIGDIGIFRLPQELSAYAKEVGSALLEAFPRLRTIAMDKGVKGEFRVRDLEVVAGDERLETVHQEYGIRLLVDPSRVYFNPRLAGERHRVASLVREGETVIDMFSGIGPFAIMIAKQAKPFVVFALDLNPDCIEYMKRNIEINKVTTVVPIEGDAKHLIFDIPCADRIVMNLPHTARQFYAEALTRLNIGGTIHFYHICERHEIDSVLEQMVLEARGMGVCVDVAHKEELKTYSPSASVFSADLFLRDWC
jgi:tRNA (guanine37-N1)-methyltransferase